MSEALLDAPPGNEKQIFFESLEDAEEAARLRKRDATESGLVIRVERSPYGAGYVVRSVPLGFLSRPRLRPLLRPLARNYGQ